MRSNQLPSDPFRPLHVAYAKALKKQEASRKAFARKFLRPRTHVMLARDVERLTLR